MGDAHGGIRRVDVLSAFAEDRVRIDTQIFRQSHFNRVVDFRIDGNRSGDMWRRFAASNGEMLSAGERLFPGHQPKA